MNLETSHIHLPPQLIVELAAGILEPVDLAEKWGYDVMNLTALAESQAIKPLIAAKKAELEQSGASFRMKCAVMAEDLALDVYKKAIDPDTGFTPKLEAFKYFSKLANLEPQPNAGVQAGPGFSVVINIPSTPGHAAQSVTINGTATPVEEPDPLAGLPAFLKGAEVESLDAD